MSDVITTDQVTPLADVLAYLPTATVHFVIANADGEYFDPDTGLFTINAPTITDAALDYDAENDGVYTKTIPANLSAGTDYLIELRIAIGGVLTTTFAPPNGYRQWY